MSLTDPTKKMSKSDDNPKSVIYLLDDLKVVSNKIKSAVTDSDTKIIFDMVNKPGISNLLTIYSLITNNSIKALEDKYIDSNYQTFKSDLALLVVDYLAPIQARYQAILKSKDLDDILDSGRDKAAFIAGRKIDKVYKRIGLNRKK